jgi:hypothetical protein
MPLTDAGRNAGLDGLAAVAGFASLHNGDPSTTGANELTGGAPAYARKAVTYAAASAGTRASNAALTFDVPAVPTPGVAYIGLWSAITAGTFYGYYPAGGFTPMAATLDATTDAFTSYAHGLVNTNQVLVYDTMATGLSAGFTEGTIYFVVSATTDTFQLSATSGGAAITVTTAMECVVHRILPEIFAAQGQYQVASGSLILDGRFV